MLSLHSVLLLKFVFIVKQINRQKVYSIALLCGCTIVNHMQNILLFFMVAVWNRALYFHAVVSIFFFSSPNLSGRTLDVYHTSTHGVALVQI